MGMFSVRNVAIFGIILAVYMYYPPPEPSDKLKDWIRQGKYFSYQGNKVFYRDSGAQKEGPTLLLLHGFPTMSYDWARVWPALVSKFGRVIALDYLGYGFSDKPTNIKYTISMEADIVEHLLASLRVKRTHVLAHDVGDTVALELLARFNEREDISSNVELQSVCLTNGGVFPETNFPRPVQKLMLSPLGPVLSRLTNYYIFKRGFGEVFGPQTQPDAEEFKDFYAGIQHNNGNAVMHLLIDYINQRSENKNRWVGSLQEADIPIHMIYAPADPVNPPVFIDHYKKTVPKGGITVLKDHIGHYPAWEDPQGTVQAYFDFVTTLPY